MKNGYVMLENEELERVTGGFGFRNFPYKKKTETKPKYDLTGIVPLTPGLMPVVIETEPAMEEVWDPLEALAYENNML